MGPQFAHIETYSVKQNKAGNSVAQVLGEAIRDALYSQHISSPQPPRLVYGVDIPMLRILHDQMIAGAATVATVKGKQLKRAIRKDRNTLMTVVSSYPVPVADLDNDETGETRRMYDRWVALNVGHFKEKYGNQLKTVIEHDDEEYPHVHAYILPDEDPGVFADGMHPGRVAKAAAAVAAKSQGLSGREVTKVTNTAYRKAMREWQGEYYGAVGAPCGLTRVGPRRARLSRAQWQADKANAVDLAKVIEGNEATTLLLAEREQESSFTSEILEVTELANDLAAAVNVAEAERLSALEKSLKEQASTAAAELQKEKNAVAIELRITRKFKSDLEDREEELDGIFRLANVMIRTVAEKLGVSPIVNAVVAAIKAFLEKPAPVDPLIDRPSEDRNDDTDGPDF